MLEVIQAMDGSWGSAYRQQATPVDQGSRTFPGQHGEQENDLHIVLHNQFGKFVVRAAIIPTGR